MRILVVEDEVSLQAQIKRQLTQDGYMVDSSGNGEEGLYFASEFPFDAAIVDLGLPEMSGIEVIRRLRLQGSKLPILILTARGRWQDKVEGLEAGADDYMAKPFHMEELLARLKALLRRSASQSPQELSSGLITINPETQEVRVREKGVELTAFEYRLLEYLMRNSGKIISKSRLSDYLYPHDEDRDSNVIEVMVGRLRKKLDPEDTYHPIETSRSRGYRFKVQN
ncbi:MAG: response regulator transcription factor [Mariprofundaceae bacterium]